MQFAWKFLSAVEEYGIALLRNPAAVTIRCGKEAADEVSIHRSRVSQPRHPIDAQNTEVELVLDSMSWGMCLNRLSVTLSLSWVVHDEVGDPYESYE